MKNNKKNYDSDFYKSTLRLDRETYQQLKNISEKTGDSMAEVLRNVIKKGLAYEWMDDHQDPLASLIRQQLDIVMKPHVERLAALSSKGSHMAATAAFLNVQALMDLVPPERKKDVREMYESARKKAVEYMRTKPDNFK